MKAIQIVVDENLLRRVDRAARRQRVSRSAIVRRLLEVGLERESLAALAEAERRAYAEKPLSAAERDALGDLQRAQERVLDELAREDAW